MAPPVALYRQKDIKMINQAFVIKTELTEKKAQRFFEHNPGCLTPGELIVKAAQDGYSDNPEIDWDLFKHLMKKYHYIGY